MPVFAEAQTQSNPLLKLAAELLERFREAAEAVFHHPLLTETLDDCRCALLEERREMKAETAPSEPVQEIGPVMM